LVKVAKMTRLTREQLFTPDEIVTVHVMNRAVRRCFLMGYDQYSGRNYDYRKDWIELRIEHLAKFFSIDVLAYSILSNHFHLVLRQRPDVVKTWDDTEVARRWLMICPKKKNKDGSPKDPTQPQLNSIRNDAAKVAEIRSRLSDISWWMRLMCQTIAQRINAEDQISGKVWESRFRAVRLLDESALLACAAYVDLNPIRAALAETLEQSDFTSIQRRIQALKQQIEAECLDAARTLESQAAEVGLAAEPTSVDARLSEQLAGAAAQRKEKAAEARDRSLAPIHLRELRDALQILPSRSGYRCSDRGFLNMSSADYIELLDWTARCLVPGKCGATPVEAPPIFERLGLGLSAGTWCELVANFGKLFKIVAGKPHVVDAHRGVRRPKRFKLSKQARELLKV
jgi:REP element-mobilizing transposase RayT